MSQFFKKILITGHKGFIGQNLFNFLKTKNLNVFGYDKKDGPFDFNEVKKFDCVIHLGANSHTTEQNLNKILNENFIFSQKLYEECCKNNIHFQYASSASVYGQSKSFLESEFCSPSSPYALSKYMFDCWIEALGKKNYQGFRYFNVYGNFEHHKYNQASPITKFYLQAKKDKEIQIFENSNLSYRDFICVEDVCKIHLKFLQNKDLCGIWNVGTGEQNSFFNIAKMIQEKTSCKIIEIPFPQNLKKHYQFNTKANLTKLKNDIGPIEFCKVKDWINDNY